MVDVSRSRNRSEQILGDRLATIQDRIKHYENSNLIASGQDPRVVDPNSEIELRNVLYLGYAYVDESLARHFVRIEGDGERPKVLGKLALINSDFAALYITFRDFEQAYFDLTSSLSVIEYHNVRTPFIQKFSALVEAIRKLPI